MKRLLSILLALVLVFGTLTSITADPRKAMPELDKKAPRNLNKSLTLDQSLKGLGDGDLVRIIVELGDKPLIEYATEKNVKLNKLDKSIEKKIKDNLAKSRESVKKDIKAKKISIKYHNEFMNVANGFSGTTTLGEAKRIEGLAGVLRVAVANEYSRPIPQMIDSKDLIKAKEAWAEMGFNGEGMVVSIIDTGVDPSHKDMVISSPQKVKLDQASVNSLISQHNLAGVWHTDKVPYGYNYMDNNQEILDLGPDASRHGMHVAGTVAANGDEENGGIKGVAPEAQLLAMKVFGNNPAMPSTFGDVIVKAIDDSVALGADVINMSLGSTASYVIAEDLEQVAIKRATENGVVNAVSAGNSAYTGAPYDPYATNPDVGLIGSPGLAPDTIQVASANNKLFLHENTVIAPGLDKIIGYGRDSWEERGVSGEVELIALGGDKLGSLDNYEGIDVTGKVVFVSRGEYTFYDKTAWAAKKGAAGIICYNSTNPVFYKDLGAWSIPFMKTNRANGLALEELLKDGPITIEISTTKKYMDPSSGSLSDFSSWGTTPDLDFKPEITAPGGNIYSTDQNNGYQFMSGTSMAAPHIAGGAALVLQRVDKEFGLTGRARIEMAKNLIMSTAKPVSERFEFTSPRRQGAGMMDLYDATTTPTILVDSSTNISKVNLREMGDVTTFDLTVKNFSNKAITYKVNGTVSTNLSIGGDIWMEPQSVVNVDWTTEEETYPIAFDLASSLVTVPANSTVQFKATIDLTEAVDWALWESLKTLFPNGNFIEGFVQLEDVDDDDEVLDLCIPYMGFYGKWDQAPIIDPSIYDESQEPYYGFTGMLDADTFTFLEMNEDNALLFSPNQDGYLDRILPVLSFLRNARELDINILDDKGNKVRDLYYEEYVRKNINDYGSSLYRIHEGWLWDGTINNKPAKDGYYIYEVRARIDFENAQWQSLRFPIRVDTTAPIVESVTYDKSSKKLLAAATDGKYGIMKYELIDNNLVIAQSTEGEFDLSKLNYSNKAQLKVYDMAWNTTLVKLESILKGDKKAEVTTPAPIAPPAVSPTPTPPEEKFVEPTGPAQGDTTVPTVMVTSPEFFGIYNKSTLSFTGYIEDASSIEYLRINGKGVPYVFNKATGVWDFAALVTLADGYHSVNVEAKDSAGNSIAFAHKVFVDTTAPVINIINPPSSTKESSIVITADLFDNLPSMRVLVNGNMVTNIAPDWSYFNELASASYKLQYRVELQDGQNTIVIEAIDDGGNKTIRTIKVNKIKNNDKK